MMFANEPDHPPASSRSHTPILGRGTAIDLKLEVYAIVQTLDTALIYQQIT